RDPAARRAAFDRLKQVVIPGEISASSTPFMGHADLLQEVAAIVEKSRSRLKAVLIVGPPGIGKSRFVSELRLREAFRGVASVIFRSRGASAETTPLVNSVVKFIETGTELRHGREGIRASVATILKDEHLSVSRENDRPPEKIAAT